MAAQKTRKRTPRVEPSPAPRRVGFQLHSNLLDHLVKSQAATPEKALLELVMNAADAGASEVDVSISPTGFVVHDNGRGFQSETEIENFFATFGTPHADGDATFGRFRIGRAQIMGFASTHWASNEFILRVDLRADARGFELETNPVPQPGCRIVGQWYPREPHDHRAIEHHRLGARLARMLEYPPLRVVIDGAAIETTEQQPWTHETENAFYRLSPAGNLAVFNQGVRVRGFDNADFHVGGVVVSKKAMALIMSRQDFEDDCPVFAVIAKELRQFAAELHSTGLTVGTEEYRRWQLSELLAGLGDPDAEVITILPRRAVSLPAFFSALWKAQCRFAIADYGQIVVGERMAKWYRMPVIHHETLGRIDAALGLDGSEEPDRLFGRFLAALMTDSFRASATYRRINDDLVAYEWGVEPGNLTKLIQRIDRQDFAVLARRMKGYEGSEVDVATLPAKFKRYLQWIKNPLWWLGNALGVHGRVVGIGTSRTANAWTDGSMIVFEKRFLAKCIEGGGAGLLDLVNVALHEYCHEHDSLNVGHDQQFLELFHERATTKGAALFRAIEQIAINRLIDSEYGSAPGPVGKIAWVPPEYTRDRWEAFRTTPEYRSDVVHSFNDLNHAWWASRTGEGSADDLAEAIERHRKSIQGSNWDYRRVTRLRFAAQVRRVLVTRPPTRLPDVDGIRSLMLATTPLRFEFSYSGAGNTRLAVRYCEGRVLEATYRAKQPKVELAPGLPDTVWAAIAALLDPFVSAFPWDTRDIASDLPWVCAMIATRDSWLHDLNGGHRLPGDDSRVVRHPEFRFVDQAFVDLPPPAEATPSAQDELEGAVLPAMGADLARAAADKNPGLFWLDWL